MFRHFFKVFFCAVIFFLCASAPVSAESASDDYDDANIHVVGDWSYTVLKDGTAALSGYYGSEKNVTVPSEIDGYTITVLGGGWYTLDDTVYLYGNIHSVVWDDEGDEENDSDQSANAPSDAKVYSPFSDNTDIVSVTIPDTVTIIGSISFSGCTSLVSVTMSENTQIIGNNCFDSCTSLTSIEIPSGAVYVDLYAFENCSSLSSVALSASCGYAACAFENCTALKSVVIPYGIENISPYMFSGCSSLESVTLPDGLTQIGQSAFLNCVSLVSVTLPDSVTEILNNAFSGCTSLTSVYLGQSLTTLAGYAFADCPLTSLQTPNTIEVIGQCAFGMTSDEELIDGFTLICKEGSVAHTYAEGCGIAVKFDESETFSEEEAVEDNSGKLIKLFFAALVLLTILLFLIILFTILSAAKKKKKAAAKAKTGRKAANRK